jgi:senataxin
MQQTLRQYILNRCSIVFSTLTTSSLYELRKLLTSRFDSVIVDEAAQAVELACITPLCYCMRQCILVGDSNQLPATVLSTEASFFDYEQSLFERLEKLHFTEVMLKEQYRMHKEIRTFPSRHFYSDLLCDGQNVASYFEPFYKVP